MCMVLDNFSSDFVGQNEILIDLRCVWLVLDNFSKVILWKCIIVDNITISYN